MIQLEPGERQQLEAELGGVLKQEVEETMQRELKTPKDVLAEKLQRKVYPEMIIGTKFFGFRLIELPNIDRGRILYIDPVRSAEGDPAALITYGNVKLMQVVEVDGETEEVPIEVKAEGKVTGSRVYTEPKGTVEVPFHQIKNLEWAANKTANFLIIDPKDFLGLTRQNFLHPGTYNLIQEKEERIGILERASDDLETMYTKAEGNAARFKSQADALKFKLAGIDEMTTDLEEKLDKATQESNKFRMFFERSEKEGEVVLRMDRQIQETVDNLSNQIVATRKALEETKKKVEEKPKKRRFWLLRGS